MLKGKIMHHLKLVDRKSPELQELNGSTAMIVNISDSTIEELKKDRVGIINCGAKTAILCYQPNKQ